MVEIINVFKLGNEICLRAAGRTVTCKCAVVGAKASFVYVRSLETASFLELKNQTSLDPLVKKDYE